MLPHLVVRIRDAVRHLTGLDAHESELSGEQNEQGWDDMIARVRSRDREAEWRLRRAERGLNRSSFS